MRLVMQLKQTKSFKNSKKDNNKKMGRDSNYNKMKNKKPHKGKRVKMKT